MKSSQEAAVAEQTHRLTAFPAGAAWEVLAAFTKLGVSSFGGPIAHLGYFRDELVIRRKWIDEEGYADIVALCQFLPGPASCALAPWARQPRGPASRCLPPSCSFSSPMDRPLSLERPRPGCGMA